MEIKPWNNPYTQWLYNKHEITFLKAFIFFCLSIVFLGLMVTYYHGVVDDIRLINDNLMFRMLKEAPFFMTHINESSCGTQILKDYKWLKTFNILINENCHVTSSNFQHLRIISYIMSLYNTLLIHVLFTSSHRISVLTYVPIVIASCSVLIDSQEVFILGMFSFTQVSLSIITMTTFIYLKERKMQSSFVIEKKFE
jgi:hypothetical protein